MVNKKVKALMVEQRENISHNNIQLQKGVKVYLSGSFTVEAGTREYIYLRVKERRVCIFKTDGEGKKLYFQGSVCGGDGGGGGGGTAERKREMISLGFCW